MTVKQKENKFQLRSVNPPAWSLPCPQRTSWELCTLPDSSRKTSLPQYLKDKQYFWNEWKFKNDIAPPPPPPPPPQTSTASSKCEHLHFVDKAHRWESCQQQGVDNAPDLISWKYAKPLICAYISNQDERICMFGSCLTHRGLRLVTLRIWCRRFYHHRRIISEKSFCLHGSIHVFLLTSQRCRHSEKSGEMRTKIN